MPALRGAMQAGEDSAAQVGRLRRLWLGLPGGVGGRMHWQARWPGSLLCVVIAMAASFVARVHGGPQLLYALFFGIAFHFLAEDAKIKPGIEFCTRRILHLGVGLLGARITATQIAALGWSTALIIVAAVLCTVAFGIFVARRLGLTATQGMLSGGATAICGASAALAIAAVLPRSREQERFTLLVVVCVTSLSTLAMLIYPLIAQAFGLPPQSAGLFLGGSIHDVAQVIGAGYTMGPAVGDAATLVKMLRISLLALVVVIVAAAGRRHGRSETCAGQPAPPLVPWFLQMFLLLVVINSLHGVPEALQAPIGDASRACLVVAIAGLGVKTSFQTLFVSGWRPFALLLIETIWLAAFMLCAALMVRPG